MSIRIEIELTSSAPDGSWTWRAAGAREPRGVLDGSILPPGSSVGDQLRVETEKDIDGIRVLAVVPGKEKQSRSDVLQLLPAEDSFEPVIQQRAPRSSRDEGPRRPRRDRPGDERGERRRERPDRPDRGERREGDRAGRRGGERPAGDREHPAGDRRPGGEDRRRQRPHFTPPPEVPQRPKPKRLRPGKQHRTDVLEALPEEQRPVAELALQGIAAVRQRLREDNARLRAEGKPEMPEAAVMRMAEDLIPRLRVADWLDRADAAQRQMEHLDLRDLRSVVAASDDPVVARDESTRELASALKAALVTKQDEELTLWLADVEAALDVGRVVRALRLSSVPPKAGVPFPGALAARLGDATTASLQPGDGPDRWSAVLEAAAFSPVRSLVAPTAAPEQRSDELVATVRRLAPLLPQVAALFDIEVRPGTAVPKPLRPMTRRPETKKAAAKPAPSPRQPPPPPEARGREAAGSPAGVAGAEVARSPAEGDAEPPAAPVEAAAVEAAESPPKVAEAAAAEAPESAEAAGSDLAVAPGEDAVGSPAAPPEAAGSDAAATSPEVAEAAAVEAAESPVEDGVGSPAAPPEAAGPEVAESPVEDAVGSPVAPVEAAGSEVTESPGEGVDESPDADG